MDFYPVLLNPLPDWRFLDHFEWTGIPDAVWIIYAVKGILPGLF